MPGSEINGIQMALRELKTDWEYLCEMISHGDGTGRLARVASVANGTGVTTVTCDNTYIDFGIENVQALKAGSQIEIYAADGTLRNLNGVGYAVVTGVTFGNRGNGAATTGTFTYADADNNDGVANGDVVYIRGSHSSGVNESTYYAAAGTDNICMPVGLLGLLQDASADHLIDGGIDYKLSTFQGLTRADYPQFYAKVINGSDINSGTINVPGEWDLSVITDLMIDGYKASGAYVDVIFASSKMAACMQRLQPYVINATDPVSGAKMTSTGGMYASKFLRPDGGFADIVISQSVPDNVVYGICSEHLSFSQRKEPDFLRLYGDVWGPTKGDSYAQFEAPYGGYYNFTAERLDGCFVACDLKTNL